MIRRRSSLAVSEETPKDAFIGILRSLSERSGQYFWGLNALEDDSFGIHKLLDLSEVEAVNISSTKRNFPVLH
jgi:hypothetical protein